MLMQDHATCCTTAAYNSHHIATISQAAMQQLKFCLLASGGDKARGTKLCGKILMPICKVGHCLFSAG